jgi:hydroxyacylglutathione hydrolase
MKVSVLSFILATFCQIASLAQWESLKIGGKEVFKNSDVIFHEIDSHTWVGTGHLLYNESIYLIEGTQKAVLVDAGRTIKDLDKIVASITKKPVMLVVTHVHSDHTGAVNYFPEVYLNPADSAAVPQTIPNYKGKVKYLSDGEIIDLGGRKLEVVFTPGHTPGSTTFIDKDASYGFSGDSFGSGNLLLTGTFSTLIATCSRVSEMMQKYKISYFYPGHFSGDNLETKQRIDDLITLSKDVLSGKLKGQANPQGMMGLNLIVNEYGVRINYKAISIK